MMWLCSRADIATLGSAISLVTAARVALATCFFVFLLPTHHDFRSRGHFLVNLDQANASLACYRNSGAVTTFSSFRSSDLSQSI
jgi:hypothetical protein